MLYFGDEQQANIETGRNSGDAIGKSPDY